MNIHSLTQITAVVNQFSAYNCDQSILNMEVISAEVDHNNEVLAFVVSEESSEKVGHATFKREFNKLGEDQWITRSACYESDFKGRFALMTDKRVK